ncbi:hypothetical protein HPB47_021539 [Ixodes persulcatus]|uniref:Uncharacterized protein n=1 Tax=Ixodes persulcatus TaxID=34615 RepID=A0AC60QCL2_IXOPE|nr:hypothetical protein HPB47_021539 [Ixodes persulcatus]
MAYCKVCKTELRPHIQDLKLHKSRLKHQNNVLLLSKPAAERIDSFVTARPRDTDPVIMYAKEIKAAELRLAAHVAVHGSFFAADHLAPLTSVISAMESEYRLLQTNIRDLSDDCLELFWKNVREARNSSGAAMFPLLSALGTALLTLPMSNAAVERVFSQVSLTKSDLRNRLSHSTLESILFVKFAFLGKKECCKDFKPTEEFFVRFNSQVMYDVSQPCTSDC